MTRRIIKQLAAEAGVDIDTALAERLESFSTLFLRWNQRINLSAARDPAALAEHIADCLALLPHIPPSTQTLVDIGSGGGLPAAILAIALPQVSVTAVEPIHKKHAFLSTVRRELTCPNFTPIAGRAEDLTRHDFDIATSRATFDLLDWLTLGQTLVHPGGLTLAMEGADQRDLPPTATRHPYTLGQKTRAIISLRKP
jgi:16S rRNA (guanine527-N7)-methyltransferase